MDLSALSTFLTTAAARPDFVGFKFVRLDPQRPKGRRQASARFFDARKEPIDAKAVVAEVHGAIARDDPKARYEMRAIFEQAPPEALPIETPPEDDPDRVQASADGDADRNDAHDAHEDAHEVETAESTSGTHEAGGAADEDASRDDA